MNKVRNSSIDVLRIILACCVVLIHNPFDVTAYAPINIMVRMAVPLFFMISGFYNVYSDKEKSIIKNKLAIKRIFILAVEANVFFLFWQMNTYRYDLENYIRGVLSPRSIINMVIFNESPFKAHLWYLNALLFCYIMSLCIAKLNAKEWICNVIMCLGLVALILFEFADEIIGKSVYNIYYRNFWFCGSAYFLIGRTIKIHKDYLVEWFKSNNNRIVAYILTLVSFLIVGIEICLTGNKEIYCLLLIPELVIFIFFMSRPQLGRDSILERLGRDYSLALYIFHPMISDLLFRYIFEDMNNTIMARIFISPLTIIVTLAIIFVFKKLRKKSNN